MKSFYIIILRHFTSTCSTQSNSIFTKKKHVSTRKLRRASTCCRQKIDKHMRGLINQRFRIQITFAKRVREFCMQRKKVHILAKVIKKKKRIFSPLTQRWLYKVQWSVKLKPVRACSLACLESLKMKIQMHKLHYEKCSIITKKTYVCVCVNAV